MRIGILTLPLHENYGGILQAYALQQVLEGMGHDTLILDKRRRVELPLFAKYRHYLVKFIKNILLGQHETIKWDIEYNNMLETIRQYTYPFLQKYMRRVELDGCYSTIDQECFDAIVVGSDQIWRPGYFSKDDLPNVYLFFAKDWDIKRISYAASFGTDEWEYTPEQTAICGALLRRFDAVSVRESSAVSLCKEHFNVDAQHVLDPTMLLDAAHYITLFQQAKTPMSEGDLMCYILDSSEAKDSLVQCVASTYGLTPFSVNSKYEVPDAPLEEKIQPPVEKWLRGFYDANYVITDSFHACVFSILFKKPFIVYGNKHRGMARFHSLLAMFGLNDRLVTTLDEASAIISRPIDWDSVHTRLSEWRQKSRDFLFAALVNVRQS